jgi:hypothetical protein
MKQVTKFLVVTVAAISIGFSAPTIQAQGGRSGGGFHGGFNGGFRQRSWGGGGWGWGWRGWYPWGFPYVYAPSPYYYSSYYYYPSTAYYQPAVVYDSQPAQAYVSQSPAPVADSPQQPDVDRPLSPTAVDRDTPPPPPRVQEQVPIQRNEPRQSIAVADVKALATAGLSDEVILSHLRNSQAVYHLTTAEIIDLKNSGVSEKIIDYMINTASARR